MSIARLSRMLLCASGVASAGAARMASGLPPSSALRTPTLRASSSLSRDSTHEPLDSMLTQCYARMARAAILSSGPHLHELCGITFTAMERCLQQDRPADAVSLYRTLCSSGLLSAVTGEQSHRVNSITLRAVRLLPHQTYNRTVLAQLLDAECEAGGVAGGLQHSPRTTTTLPPLSDVESFRIALHQRTRLLRSIGQLRMPLGRNYFLTEARNVLDSPALRADGEVGPFALLSTGILYHPFAHGQPAADWAERVAFFDQLDLLSASTARELSVAQREAVIEIEESVSPLRPLCRSTLLFLTSVASDWDEVFHRRVAQCLLLSNEAHDVFPQVYRGQRRRLRTSRQCLTELIAQESQADSLRRWTDARHDLFAAMCPTDCRSHDPGGVGPYQDEWTSLQHALRRAERILRRRAKRDIVVPDAAYILSHLHQLQQLGKHREVVITHGVLLELVRVAVLPGVPRRFQARRALRTLMQQTTTSVTAAAAETEPFTTHALRRQLRGVPLPSRSDRGGVTILGLQDELALLHLCTTGVEADMGTGTVADYTERFAEDHLVRSTRHSTVSVAQQLMHVLAAHAKGMNFTQAQCSLRDRSASLLLGDMDSLVDGIVSSRRPVTAHEPLFRNRSRFFWGNAPVVVATTDDSTRVSAYLVGLQTYPPTGST